MKYLKKSVIRRSIPTVLSAILFSASALTAAPVSAAGSEPGISAMDSILAEAIQEKNERRQLSMETGNRSFLQDTSYFKPDAAEARSLAGEKPSKFDLRDLGWVTPVKFQNPFGTCWGFATITAAESSILSELAAQGQAIDAASLDLSEKHLAWFSAHALPADSDTGQGGEGTYPGPATYEGYDSGGVMYYGTTSFSSGVGPRSESDIPYQPKDAEEHIVYNEDGQPRYYSKEADWSLDESERFGIGNGYELEESSLLPSPASYDENGVYSYDQTATDAIKNELMAGRAVSIAFRADQSRPGQELTARYINPQTWSHYTYDSLYEVGTNHAITIVGWDDGYDPSNFLEGHQPQGPGAWIVKNSWGAASNEFPNKNDWGNDGYFYLSYYDRTICMPETFDFFVGDTGHDQVYVNQYDYMTAQEIDIHDTEEKVSEANVFCAEDGDMALRSVAATTSQAGASITYDIYRLKDGYNSPTDGILEDTISKTYTYAGYHREDLEKELHFRAGEHYSVVVTQESDGRYLYGAAAGLSRAGWESKPAEEKAQTNHSMGVINPGESFLGLQDESGAYEWVDWKDFAEEYIAGSGNDTTLDNFAIKTYSDPYTFPEKTGGDLSDATVTLNEEIYTYDGKEKTPDVMVVMGDIVLINGQDYRVSYENNTRAGTATVTVTAKDDSVYTGVQEKTFTINKADLSAASVALSEETYTYDGAAKTPGVTVTMADRTLTEGQDYTVSYQNNTKAGTAAVTVTAKDDSDYTGVQEKTFTINKADLSAASVTLSSKTYTYDGKEKKPGVTVRAAGKTLVKGKDYTVSYKNNKNAGKASVTVTAKNDSDHTGSRTTNFTINKAAQTLKLNVSEKSYKAKDLKKKKSVFTIKPSRNKTSVAYKVTKVPKGASKYISVSQKGVVTMKKGAKKGIYKVSATAKASTNYKSAKKIVTITVK